MHWWQSIRWRLALGSMLVALLATGLLALAAILAINYYYNVDAKTQLTSLTTHDAQILGENYTVLPGTSRVRLIHAATQVFSRSITSTGIVVTPQGEQYVLLVINNSNQFVYPVYKSTVTDTLRATLVAAMRSHGANGDLALLRQALITGHQGKATLGEIGSANFAKSRPVMVEPIFSGGQSNGQNVGILVMTPRYAADNTIPPFISAVGGAVLVVSTIVAVVAALAAIIFSRTITRPLATLTEAARRMESGDLATRVHTHMQGEIGLLANSLNEMAAQLDRDIEELRKQELWRRELIMSITHDLATPLTAIAGLGESLVDGVSQSGEEYEATGQIIVRETLRLRRLVKDLHVMAKVEAGALQPQRTGIRLAALVDEVFAVLASEFERADVEPRNAIPFTLPVIQADADMLTRVFTNLCDNAMRHTPPDGNVTVRAKFIDTQKASSSQAVASSEMQGTHITQKLSEMKGDTLLISVTDTGEGIPSESLSFIFERFYRADSARQSATGGSGLGLAIVRAIVEAHGGRIWAENVPTGGASILFTLPLQIGKNH